MSKDRIDERFWVCIIGPVTEGELPQGADSKPRSAAVIAVTEMLGRQPECWSGWGTDRQRFEAIQKVWNSEDRTDAKVDGVIKLPVRYDVKSKHIFEASGHSVAWLSRNTHHPNWDEDKSYGEYIALCINSYAQLQADKSELEERVGKYRAALERIANQRSSIYVKGTGINMDGEREAVYNNHYEALNEAYTLAASVLADEKEKE